MVEKVSSPELVQPLKEVRELIDRALQDTRALTFELSPPVLYELGFEAAVEWLCEEFQAQHDLQVVFQDDRQQKPLNDAVAVLLFQGVRELLTNVVKHAQAQFIRISVQEMNAQIRVKVEDDGVGFDTSRIGVQNDTGSGFGLLNLRVRLEHMNGEFLVDSRPGSGTRIELAAPLKPQSDHA